MRRRPRALDAAVLAAALSALLAASGLVASARAHAGTTTWPYTALMQRIDGARVRLPDRVIRVDRDLVICNGEGTPVIRAGVRRWKHFTCTQTLIQNGRVGRDATFRVHVVSPTRFLITDPRYGPD